MQILEEEKSKLDNFCEQSLKNVSTYRLNGTLLFFGSRIVDLPSFSKCYSVIFLSSGHDAGKTQVWFCLGKTVFVGQTLFGLSHQHSIDVRRTP